MPRQRVIAVVLVLVVVGVAWWLWPRAQEAPAPTAEPAAPATPETSPTQEVAEPAAEPLPPLEASDTLARDVLDAAGVGAGGLAAVLDEDELVRRFVAAVAAVAAGQSPRAQIGFLQPEESFLAEVTDAGIVVDPRSYARYDAISRAIGGLDAGVLVERYARMEPLFQSAYDELGEPGAFRPILLQALDLLLATPVPSPPVLLEDYVEKYVYADHGLEALSTAQKHLLRLGPDNQRIVQNKLRELRAGVGRLPPS